MASREANDMKKFGKVVVKIIDLIKGPAFVIVILLGLLSLLVASNAPWRMPYKPFIVLSGSMRPVISEGSVVFVRRGPENLKVNDIITFLRPDNSRDNVTHRIIGKTDFGYKTQGDANNSPDAWTVRKEAVWGKVIFTQPYLGYVLSFSRTKPGVILLIALPLFIIILDEIRVILNELRKRQKKKTATTNQVVVEVLALALGLSCLLYGSETTSLANFSHSETVSNNQIATDCWLVPSVPGLVSPVDGYITNGEPTFDWADSLTTCPLPRTISYQYESYTDLALTSLYYRSGWLADSSITPAMSDGNYYWRVRAKDNAGYVSAFSPARLLVVDRVSPSAPTLSVTGSWTKAVEEDITNGDFSQGLTGWTTSGDIAIKPSDVITNATPVASVTVTPLEGTNMVRIGQTSGSSGNQVWENRLMQSFNSGAKSLTLNYNLFTRDYFPWDDPAFFIRLNGQEIFATSSGTVDPANILDDKARSTGWQKFAFDLSNYQDNSKLNLSLYAGNTDGEDYQSWVYIDKVTTYFVAAPLHAVFHLFGGADNIGGSGIGHYQYRIDFGVWQNGADFSMPAGGSHTVEYRIMDAAGNISPISMFKVITDDVAPSDVVGLEATTLDSSAIKLTWGAPGNDGHIGRATSYDLRYSTATISASNFDAATRIDRVPAPNNVWDSESFTLTGLNPSTTYYFSLKSSDEAPNVSNISNVAWATTNSGVAINEGDVVINELMWGGTAIGSVDKYLELRNMTDREISLDDVKLTKLSGGAEIDMITADNFAGKKISPKGYFLISNLVSASSALAENVVPDLVTPALELSNTELQIKLYWNAVTIDTAGDEHEPFEGLFDDNKYYSMERTSAPGNGWDPLSWYTCIDVASHADFFDVVSIGDERGTPGKENRSENEPLSRLKGAVKRPSLNLKIGEDLKSVNFEAQNIQNFQKLDYEVTYDSDLAPQGVIGSATLSGELNYQKQIILGTCSTGGTCVYQTGVKNFNLKVELTDPSGNKTTLKTSL